jgi:hypothetical protein
MVFAANGEQSVAHSGAVAAYERRNLTPKVRRRSYQLAIEPVLQSLG